MNCPACAGVLTTLVSVHGVSICPSCLRSIVADENGYRLATSADTVGLAATEIGALKDLRKTARKEKG